MLDSILSRLQSSVEDNYTKAQLSAIEEFAFTSTKQDSGLSSGSSGSFFSARHENRPDGIVNAALAAFLGDISTDLRDMRNDVRVRANRSYNLMITFAAISAATILAAVGLAVEGTISETTLTAVASIISGSAATGLWKVYKTEVERADILLRDLQKAEHARVAYLLKNTPQHNRVAEKRGSWEWVNWPSDDTAGTPDE